MDLQGHMILEQFKHFLRIKEQAPAHEPVLQEPYDPVEAHLDHKLHCYGHNTMGTVTCDDCHISIGVDDMINILIRRVDRAVSQIPK